MRLIDADAMVKKLINESPAIGMVSVLMESWFYAAIKSMPTIDAEPVRRGRWMTCEDGWGDMHYQCSECGDEWTLNDGTPKENNMYYCPHCGARMDGDAHAAD